MKTLLVLFSFLALVCVNAQEKKVKAVNSVFDLLTLNPEYYDTDYIVEGYTNTADGGAALFRYYNSNVATNTTTVFAPNGNYSGRWIMLGLNLALFDTNSFTVSTNSIRFSGAGVTNVYSTNLYSSNIFVYNTYTTNLYASNAYITNVYVEQEFYSSNSYTTNLTVTQNIRGRISYISNLYVTNLFIGTNQVFAYNFNTNQFATNTDFMVSIKNGASVTNLTSYSSLVAEGIFAMGVGYEIYAATAATNDITTQVTSWVQIASDSSTPGARIIRLNAGTFFGQFLIIQNDTSGNTFTLPNNSAVVDGGFVRLSGADWTAQTGESMLLVYDAVLGSWNEIGRFGSGTTSGIVANLTQGFVPFASSTNTLADSPIFRVSSTNLYIPRITIGTSSNYFSAASGVPTLNGRIDLYNTANGTIGINIDTYSPTNVANAVAAEFILFETGSGNRDISYGFYIENDVNSRGATLTGDPAGDGNTGAWIDSNANGVNSVGLIGNSRGSSTNNIGIIARVMRQNSSSTTNIALLAEVERPGAYTPTQVGIYVAPTAVATTNLNPVTSLILADNLDTSYPILIGRTAGTQRTLIDENGYFSTARITWDTAFNTQSSLTYAATTDLDFAGIGARALNLTGNITFTTSNRAAGRMLKVKILADGSTRTFTFPSWKWVGSAAPANIAASKTMILSLECWGSNDTDIVAAYAVEQ